MKQTNKKQFNEWLNSYIEKGYTFKYNKGLMFKEEVIISVTCIESGTTFSFEYIEPKSRVRFPIEKVEGIQKDCISQEAWFKVRKRKTEETCSSCKRSYKIIGGKLGLLFLKGSLNQDICYECSDLYISMGARDIKKERENHVNKKEELIKSINDLGNYGKGDYYQNRLQTSDTEKLEIIYNEYKAKSDEQDRIDLIEIPVEDRGMEEYLETDYNVIEDWKYLKCEEQFESYFKDVGQDLFDCGQGYYEDEATVICKIGKKYYSVTIKAEIGSAKQDRGDRLYWIEEIEGVTWEEIDKPEPKDRFSSKIVIEDMTEADLIKVLAFLDENGLSYELD